MVGYEFYCWRDPKGYELIGVLPERRNNPQRITKESVLNWGQKYFAIHLNPMVAASVYMFKFGNRTDGNDTGSFSGINPLQRKERGK
jgi:hypothetical protein